MFGLFKSKKQKAQERTDAAIAQWKERKRGFCSINPDTKAKYKDKTKAQLILIQEKLEDKVSNLEDQVDSLHGEIDCISDMLQAMK